MGDYFFISLGNDHFIYSRGRVKIGKSAGGEGCDIVPR